MTSMEEGLFNVEPKRSRLPLSLIPLCGACGLKKGCNSPLMPVSGEGRRKILIVGEAPGAQEDAKGIQFVGDAGDELRLTLAKLGVDMRRDCWLDNSLRCRPPNNVIDDMRKIDYCRPNVINTIRQKKPEVIILLGYSALKSVVSWLFREGVGDAIGKWAGWRIPAQRINAWVCPCNHPSYVIRAKSSEDPRHPVIKLWFEKHLEAALKLKGRPWPEIPSYEDEVEVVLDHKRAAKIIRHWNSRAKAAAFDFENTPLKPDADYAHIVCCSVCWDGERTISFPWHGEAVKAMREFLANKGIGKIASNMKHEHRWTKKEYGKWLQNWVWDTMLAAHVLDNRPGITGLKFQSFVRLGQEPHDERVKEYLKPYNGKRADRGANEPNRIKECDLHLLLKYCGLDSLLEYKVAQLQMKEFGKEGRKWMKDMLGSK